MAAKSTKRSEVTATNDGLKPGDFRIGSPESRAAARALIASSKLKLSSSDRECLLIARLKHRYIDAGTWPDYHAMESCPAYQRGWELLSPSFFGPITIDLKLHPYLFAGQEFVKEFDREPQVGDVLRWTDLWPRVQAAEVDYWHNVWERRVPEHPFPLLLDGGYLFVRLVDYAVRDLGANVPMPAGFKPVWHEFPLYHWCWVEDQVLGNTGDSSRWLLQLEWRKVKQVTDLMPRIPAVVFGEDGTVMSYATEG